MESFTERQFAQWHLELIPAFIENFQANVFKRIDAIQNIVNDHPLSHASSSFKIDLNTRKGIMSMIKPEIEDKTKVNGDGCKKLPTNCKEYFVISRNRLNRNKPQILGNYVFSVVIFEQLYNHCRIQYNENPSRLEIMTLFISILSDIFEGEVNYQQTKPQPIIPYNTLIKDNLFRNGIKNLLIFYKITPNNYELTKSENKGAGKAQKGFNKMVNALLSIKQSSILNIRKNVPTSIISINYHYKHTPTKQKPKTKTKTNTLQTPSLSNNSSSNSNNSSNTSNISNVSNSCGSTFISSINSMDHTCNLDNIIHLSTSSIIDSGIGSISSFNQWDYSNNNNNNNNHSIFGGECYDQVSQIDDNSRIMQNLMKIDEYYKKKSTKKISNNAFADDNTTVFTSNNNGYCNNNNNNNNYCNNNNNQFNNCSNNYNINGNNNYSINNSNNNNSNCTINYNNQNGIRITNPFIINNGNGNGYNTSFNNNNNNNNKSTNMNNINNISNISNISSNIPPARQHINLPAPQQPQPFIGQYPAQNRHLNQTLPQPLTVPYNNNGFNSNNSVSMGSIRIPSIEPVHLTTTQQQIPNNYGGVHSQTNTVSSSRHCPLTSNHCNLGYTNNCIQCTQHNNNNNNIHNNCIQCNNHAINNNNNNNNNIPYNMNYQCNTY